MGDRPTRTTLEFLLGLFTFAGWMLLMSAVPIGIVVSLQEHYKFLEEWRWAMAKGAILTVATALVGGLMAGIGQMAVDRRARTR